MEKLSNEFVKQYFKEQGCELLEEYVNSKDSMRYTCVCGNISKTNWSNFKKGVRCKQCGIRNSSNDRKLTQEYVAEKFESQGCKLLGKYENSSTPVKYMCVCGNTSKIKWDAFKSVVRCRNCHANARKLKHEYVNQVFEKRGCILLEKYVNSQSPLKYICVCGLISTINFNHFNNRNIHTCKKCYIKSRSGENSPWWNKNRDVVKLNEILGKKYKNMLRNTFYCLGKTKNDKSVNLLGYTPKELKDHIVNHPNWENVKNLKWDIDHIFPIKAFVEHDIVDCKLINSLRASSNLLVIKTLNS